MNSNNNISIPSWLSTPPNTQVNPPVKTNIEELPINELHWEDFERLCLQLVRSESNIEFCRMYGERGEKQEGIDFYARKKKVEKYRVYQCKRVKTFGPAKIKTAVSKFLEGDWRNKSETFILCTRVSLKSIQKTNAIEEQRKKLKKKRVKFSVWDKGELSVMLKNNSHIVNDFFGIEWVKRFCGEEAAKNLELRLSPNEILDLRDKLKSFYTHLFNEHDPALLISAGQLGTLPLEERYVIPDVYEESTIFFSTVEKKKDTRQSEEVLRSIPFSSTFRERSTLDIEPIRTDTMRQRRSIDHWLSSGNRLLIIGNPGTGKSTLLRFVALDILQETPRLTKTSLKWGSYLPIWIPFALWTKMIVDNQTNSNSLSELLKRWFNGWDEGRLWLLVKSALKDERLLLLVDGLDEWVNKSAADNALDKLNVFIKQRDIPVIVSSRPQGFEGLEIGLNEYKLGELSEFSLDQQYQLSLKWFSHRINVFSAENSDNEHIDQQKADLEASHFLSELQTSDNLIKLAQNPLFLLLLLYHKFQNIVLPQSRFKAYDSIIENLISTQPLRRKKSATLLQESSDLKSDDVKKILGFLAYKIQLLSGAGLIDKSEAIVVVNEFLKDEEMGFGFNETKSFKIAGEILDKATDTIGIIVKRSRDEVGFYHKTFQDYLSALYISGLGRSNQLEIIDMNCTMKNWREVILCLIYLTRSTRDIDNIISKIKDKNDTAIGIERNSLESLLSELAFGEFNCSPSTAKELADNSFEWIELGSWMPQREMVLANALNGLRSTKVKDLVQHRVISWFPSKIRRRESIYNIISTWSKSKKLEECLWRGINDENISNQRAAGKALSNSFGGDERVGNRLAKLAKNTFNHEVKVIAIEALLKSWPNHKDLKSVIDDSKNSISPELRLMAIKGRILIKEHSEEDLEEIIKLSYWETGINYHWNDEIIDLLIKGWPRSEKVRTECLRALDTVGRKIRMEYEIALAVLLNGYPNDEEVVKYCVRQIRNEDYPFNSIRSDAWRLLETNFKDNSLLVDAIDQWLPNQEYNFPEISFASMVGRTETAKRKLISMLEGNFIHWPVSSLIRGWGMKDKEVNVHLMNIVEGSITQASSIGYLIPEIISDKSECRKKLFELLNDPECKRPDFVVEGLISLDEKKKDKKIANVIMKLPIGKDLLAHRSIIAALIVNYPNDERVRKIAEEEIQKRDGNIIAVAMAYGKDRIISEQILETLSPLPTNLRALIAKKLGESSISDDFSMELLKLYDFEQDPEVKTLASIGYHKLMKAQNDNSAIKVLTKSIVSYGHDLDERRQAAFSGLVILNRLDIMQDAKETIGPIDRICAISLGRWHKQNDPLTKVILDNWGYIKGIFGESLWQRLSGNHENKLEQWNTLSTSIDEFNLPRDEFIEFLEGLNNSELSSNTLRFLGRTRPGSKMLLEGCLKALKIEEDQFDTKGEEAVIVAELLGEHFYGDDDVLDRVMSACRNDYFPEKVILALCEGWPESEEMEKAFKTLKAQKRELGNSTHVRVISRMSDSTVVMQYIENFLSSVSRSSIGWHASLVRRPIIRRLQRDEKLEAMIRTKIFSDPTPSEKATLPKLISASTGIDQKLEEWCNLELHEQQKGISPPQIGFDLFKGGLNSVTHALLDVLSKVNTHSIVF